MQSTHVGLYSYLPLSLEGPKGEGDKGSEGSPVGLGRCLPKCDTNPLTLPERPCYYPHRSNTTLTISRRNQKPREAHPRPTRALNVQAHPVGRHCPTSAQANAAISSSPPGPVLPSPCPPGDGKTPWFAIVPCEAPNGDAAPSSGIAVG